MLNLDNGDKITGHIAIINCQKEFYSNLYTQPNRKKIGGLWLMQVDTSLIYKNVHAYLLKIAFKIIVAL